MNGHIEILDWNDETDLKRRAREAATLDELKEVVCDLIGRVANAANGGHYVVGEDE